jgi:hypothetical protein
MTTDDRVAALVAWWVTVYTRRLPPDVAERRRAELYRMPSRPQDSPFSQHLTSRLTVDLELGKRGNA